MFKILEKKKLSEANKGNTNMLGRNHTEESKQKMSKSINQLIYLVNF